MRVESLAQLAAATPINAAKIASVGGFCTKVEEICGGEAFLDINRAGEGVLKEALDAGAYALISDDEAALKKSGAHSLWGSDAALLLCDDINLAIARILRFEIGRKALKIYRASPLEACILRTICSHNLIKTTSLNASALIKTISDAAMEQVIVAGHWEQNLFDNALLNSIAAIEPLGASDAHAIGHSSAFFVDIRSQALSQNGVRFPAIFSQELVRVLGFMAQVGAAVKSMGELPHFRAIFVDEALRPTAFGMGARAIICESDEGLFDRELKWLKCRYSGVISGTQAEFKAALFGEKLGQGDKLGLGDKPGAPKVMAAIKKIDLNWRYWLILGDYNDILSTLNAQITTEATLF